MGIEIPNSAKDLCYQETKFKQYKSNLDMIVNGYNKVLKSIPDHLFELFQPHIKQALDLTNSGCCILTWSSLNIGNVYFLFTKL
jgi:hypothetical protein